MNPFRALFGPARREPARGFVFVGPQETGPLTTASLGSLITHATLPPWIVVDHQISRIIVARWPGRLWRVEVVKAAPAGDQPHADAGYTRASAVRIIEAAPVSSLFGDYGEAVCRVIEAARGLDLKQVEQLARTRSPLAGQVYSKAWSTWLGRQGRPMADPSEDMDGVLAIGGSGAARSPINSGLTLIQTITSGRAIEVIGATVMLTDPNDPEGAYLDEPWASAASALQDAGMSLGAPDLLEKADQDILLGPWRAVFESSN
ncbi:hypothetical protein BH11PSE2_BH11PSE2_09620 [soil metagenome]